MKSFLMSAFLLTAFSLTLSAQTDDPIIMNVAGKDIHRSDFEYSFNKNNDAKGRKDPKAIEDYVDLFINYKLKVKAAEDAQLDTLTSFKKEFATYRDMQLRPHLKDQAFIDSLALEVYKNAQEAIGDSDVLLVAHIFLQLPQKNSEAVKATKKARIDSIYAALQNGADFAEMAKKYSDDQMSARSGGELPWLGPKQTLPEFEKQAYALKPGQMSKPFLSTAGYHIILMKDRKKLEPFEKKKNEIEELLRARGVNDMAAEHRISTLMNEGKKTREEVMADVLAQAEKEDSLLQFLIEEYHDGLLLYEISNRQVWQPAAADKAGLTSYFKKNRKQYQWDEPHFKGYVIRAKNQELLDRVKKVLKKYKDSKGVQALNKAFEKDTLRSVRVKFGVYKQGEDALVDHFEFGKTEHKANSAFPFDAVVGRIIKQPETYEDVKAQVTSDYQDLKEKEWVEGLRKKYPFSVNKDVLKTVNNHSTTENIRNS